MSINRVNISGGLTRDVELRSTQGGTAIATFGVAVNDRRKNPQTGEWEDSPNYVDCVMFGKRAESIGNFIGKGSKVAIEGKLRWSQWQDKSGQKRSKLEVVVDEVEFLSNSKADSGHQSQQANNYTQQQPYAPNNGPSAPQTGYQQQYQQPYQQPYQQTANHQQGLYSEDVPF